MTNDHSLPVPANANGEEVNIFKKYNEQYQKRAAECEIGLHDQNKRYAPPRV